MSYKILVNGLAIGVKVLNNAEVKEITKDNSITLIKVNSENDIIIITKKEREVFDYEKFNFCFGEWCNRKYS